MLKRGKHACRRVCAKSVRLILERYSEYLMSRGHVPGHRRSYVRVVEHFGRWLGRRQISKSHVQQFLDQGLAKCQCPGVSRHLRRKRLSYHSACRVFGQLREILGWKKGNGELPLPRIHDLRHTFACHRLLSWYRQGKNVHNLVAALSTYLGHGKVTDTYWYLTGTPELLAIAGGRFERFAQTEKGGRA